MTDHKQIKVFPCRLSYTLRAELEIELDQLLSIECIEPSCSPYASGLVLMRKKMVDYVCAWIIGVLTGIQFWIVTQSQESMN